MIWFGLIVLQTALTTIPDLDSFERREVPNATKIYDRTGEVLLFSVHRDVKRSSISIEEISPLLQKAHIAIEDAHFYEHGGVRPTSIVRAALANLNPAGRPQGGSTITQQVVKNTVLTNDRTLTRKIKELIFAIRLEKTLSKDKILEIYLNEISYGGTLYGVEEASQFFFNKSASEVSLAEAAYIAALPQAPTYYSPFGKNREALERRKNLVLSRMHELGFVDEKELLAAQKESVSFARGESVKAQALHFVMMVREYLAERYGEDALEKNGFKVITTLDANLQSVAEKIATEKGATLEESFGAKNLGFIGLDPKAGEILFLVGSRNYFDTAREGNFNVATALRQPGSALKPIVYAAAFEQGYTPETVLFDLPTEFNPDCTPDGLPKTEVPKANCYSPKNYDDRFRGPMSLRDALAQSINIPAVKLLYLVGLNEALAVGKKMGISSLNDPNRYGLTLVLGGGEVSLLELSNAYGVFANDGIYRKAKFIKEVIDHRGNTLEKFGSSAGNRVLSEEASRKINSILSDERARAPLYPSGITNFGQPVAMKTGTTEDYHDVWVIGYTPSMVVGAWAGNNDNTPMERKVAGLIIVPVWRELVAEAIKTKPIEKFVKPYPETETLKPVLKGIWQYGHNEKATSSPEIHTILHWVEKRNPRGIYPENPETDSQYFLWETPIKVWEKANQFPRL